MRSLLRSSWKSFFLSVLSVFLSLGSSRSIRWRERFFLLVLLASLLPLSFPFTHFFLFLLFSILPLFFSYFLNLFRKRLSALIGPSSGSMNLRQVINLKIFSMKRRFQYVSFNESSNSNLFFYKRID